MAAKRTAALALVAAHPSPVVPRDTRPVAAGGTAPALAVARAAILAMEHGNVFASDAEPVEA